MADVPMLRFGDRDDWTDKWPTRLLPGIRDAHADDVRAAHEMLGDDLYDALEVVEMGATAERMVLQADAALKYRMT